MSISFLFSEDVANIKALIEIGKIPDLTEKENDAIQNYGSKRTHPLKPLLRYKLI